MTRLTPKPRDTLDDDGVALWDAIVGPRGHVVAPNGGLAGPFNAWLHAPATGAALSRLGAELRFNTSIERRLTEVAIITVGARWKAEYEWYAHSAMAREFGVSDPVIDAIGDGVEPAFVAEDERVVWALAQQLTEHGRIDEVTYRDGVGLLGEQGLVELVSLCGYYCLISFTLNAFQVELPPGEQPRWS